MITVPSGEATATNDPLDGPLNTSLDNEADNSYANSSTGGSQSPGPLPADVPEVSGTAQSTPQQDVEQTSFDTAMSKAKSTSENTNQPEVAPGRSQNSPEEITPVPSERRSTLQVFVGFQNPVWDRLAENTRKTQNRNASPRDSQSGEWTPQKSTVPKREVESVPSAPTTEAQSAQHTEVEPSADAAELSTADANGELDLQPTDVPKADEEKAQDPKILNPDTEAGSQIVTGENSVDCSRNLQGWVFPRSPAVSAPPSLVPDRVDASLYGDVQENNYMRSMTSLLGGGESSISSLADILVWSDTTMGMGMATALLASNHSSPTDLLYSTGPSLRSVSNILGSAGSAFSSGVVSGTRSTLQSINHVLESFERRTAEGMRSAVRYLISHLTHRWTQAGPH
ncbi:testis-expressed protein 44 [Castor canadensis]|uniref:testis-expressed protein 44 n=1 Tax=Castor canadensis TaxID=51338 RepID=UPI003D174622